MWFDLKSPTTHTINDPFQWRWLKQYNYLRVRCALFFLMRVRRLKKKLNYLSWAQKCSRFEQRPVATDHTNQLLSQKWNFKTIAHITYVMTNTSELPNCIYAVVDFCPLPISQFRCLANSYEFRLLIGLTFWCIIIFQAIVKRFSFISCCIMCARFGL